ncbi:hypothetical protein QE177_09070 [Arsenophonus sp. aPb]|uniref:hypothetical protein n=1 Tax=Arsenophonus sp. aPb TaxID=3041619 RepID=UPI00246961A1|nr:hypothetical protein [Arsenophonus sp. aPb]WGL97372.1 hypothetical protein QE177_09070 [Arsenophonus sp. aPb]
MFNLFIFIKAVLNISVNAKNVYNFLVVYLFEGDMENFNFKNFWNGLNKLERKAFAKQVGLSEKYIAIHVRYLTRNVSLQSVMKLHKACNEFGMNVSLEQFMQYFIK